MLKERLGRKTADKVYRNVAISYTGQWYTMNLVMALLNRTKTTVDRFSIC
jgi:hypothetical protein